MKPIAIQTYSPTVFLGFHIPSKCLKLNEIHRDRNLATLKEYYSVARLGFNLYYYGAINCVGHRLHISGTGINISGDIFTASHPLFIDTSGDGDLDARGGGQVSAAADGGAVRDSVGQDPRPAGPEREDQVEAGGGGQVRRARPRAGVGAQGHSGEIVLLDN